MSKVESARMKTNQLTNTTQTKLDDVHSTKISKQKVPTYIPIYVIFIFNI